MIDVDKAVAAAVKTGKVAFGADEALRSAKTGKAQLILVASNSPPHIRGDLEFYVKLSQVPLVNYRGSNVDLGVVCGKRFPVAALTVKEPGDSEVLKLAEERATEQDDAEEPPEEQ